MPPVFSLRFLDIKENTSGSFSIDIMISLDLAFLIENTLYPPPYLSGNRIYILYNMLKTLSLFLEISDIIRINVSFLELFIGYKDFEGSVFDIQFLS